MSVKLSSNTNDNNNIVLDYNMQTNATRDSQNQQPAVTQHSTEHKAFSTGTTNQNTQGLAWALNS